MNLSRKNRIPVRRAFTLVEVMVAGVITALVLGSVSGSLAQLGRAKNTCKQRLEAYLRADAAMNVLRRDIISVVRSDDLFDTRLLLYHDIVSTPVGDVDRDEILIFNTRLRPVRDISTFTGEGMEYETQYRVEEDEFGPALWQRRDTLPDEYLQGGGMIKPAVENIVGLAIEAYDGDKWYEEWDSDYDGLPLAVLRTAVPIDRVLQPKDHFEAEEALLRELEAEEAGEAGLGGTSSTGLDGEGGDAAGGLNDLSSGLEGGLSGDASGRSQTGGGQGGGGGSGGGSGGGHGGGGGQTTGTTKEQR
jgi:uncharacterized membrane protein YgcG